MTKRFIYNKNEGQLLGITQNFCIIITWGPHICGQPQSTENWRAPVGMVWIVCKQAVTSDKRKDEWRILLINITLIHAAAYTRPSGHKLTSPGSYTDIFKPAILRTVIKMKGPNQKKTTTITTGSIGLCVTTSMNAIYMVNYLMNHWIFYFMWHQDIVQQLRVRRNIEQCMFN